MVNLLILFLVVLAVALVGINLLKNKKEHAKKVVKAGGIIAAFLFLLRLGPAMMVAIINLIPLLLPFLKKETKVSEQMTKQEAAEVLGVTEDATEEQISHAYIELIKKNHPDKGGSKYLAQKINTAKKVLLSK